MDNKFYTFTLVDPEGQEMILTTTQPVHKKVYHSSDLSPMTDEEHALIFTMPYSPPLPSLY